MTTTSGRDRPSPTPTSDGEFQAYGGSSDASVYFYTPNHWWSLNFGAADGQALVVGPYENAVRHAFRGSGENGLDVYGDGRGCSTITGRFDVHEIVLGGSNEIVSFWATFEQHCEGMAPALRGEVRYNANVPLQLSGPGALSVRENQPLEFAVTASDTLGRHVPLAANVPFGASFVDLGNNTATFSWTPLASQVGVHLVVIQGTNGVDTETLYVTITVTPTPPPNDEVEDAILISGVPFTYTQQTESATTAPDDPFCGPSSATVWFSFTPARSERIEFNTTGSSYYATLSAYTGTRGNLNRLACSEGWGSRIRFDVTAGTMYVVMVGSASWNYQPGGSLQLNVQEAPPPFTMEFTVAPFSHVDPSTGAVTVLGTVTCSSQSYVFISGWIRQDRAGHAANGYYGAFVPCDGTTPFAAPASYSGAPALFKGRSAMLFSGGRAEVSGEAQVYDPVEGTYIYRHLAAAIQLRGGRNP